LLHFGGPNTGPRAGIIDTCELLPPFF
jgi:hypothetical protein